MSSLGENQESLPLDNHGLEDLCLGACKSELSLSYYFKPGRKQRQEELTVIVGQMQAGLRMKSAQQEQGLGDSGLAVLLELLKPQQL